MTFYIDLDYTSKEKYDIAKFLEFNVDNYDPLTSYFLDEIIKLPLIGKYTIQSEQYKPTLISYDIYQDVNYWWLLMVYNNIFDIRKLTTNTILNYFSKSDLDTLYFSLKSRQVLNDNLKNTEVTKVANTTNSDKNIVLTQVILSQVWEFKHNLKKRPSITVIVKDLLGNEIVVHPKIIYPVGFEESKVRIEFSSLQKGKVILN